MFEMLVSVTAVLRLFTITKRSVPCESVSSYDR
jgi:hypothetical protein